MKLVTKEGKEHINITMDMFGDKTIFQIEFGYDDQPSPTIAMMKQVLTKAIDKALKDYIKNWRMEDQA